MPTYILDMLVEEAQLYWSLEGIQGPLWLTIRADGLGVAFDTPQVPASPNPSWRTPVRLILNLQSLEGRHFKTMLHSLGSQGQLLSLACSQIRLSILPNGRPARFSFPLQNTVNFSVQAATLSVTASISEVRLTPAVQRGPAPALAGPAVPGGGRAPPNEIHRLRR
jgi:hypothetical protein